ncbi:MAG: 6,7-dimethyl-8-ribityllumazine synthase [Candidatus Aminicenantes bacterium]|nr:6,7-dimethyl-8-ribityllumazine synthase [Candidatus Aminicenantes bacterium]
MRIHEGKLKGEGLAVAIVVSRFNSRVTERLLDGALDGLRRTGVDEGNIEIWKTPGSFELPLVASKLASTKKYNAVICLGAVIRGDTPHFDFVASEVAKGIAQASLQSGVPVIFGVVTTDTLEQAMERAGGKMGNRGFDAALSAVELANLMGSSEI